jgi:hypothetical protein
VATKTHRLPILTLTQPPQPASPQQSDTQKRQDCARCAHVRRCWDAKAEARVVAINLLVCRIQSGTDVNRSVRLLLAYVRPKIATIGEYVFAQLRGAWSRDQIIHELEMQTILHVKNTYKIPSIGYPLHYLFGPHGAVTFDARSIVRRVLRDPNNLTVDIDHQIDSADDERQLTESEIFVWDAEAELDRSRMAERLYETARDLLTVDEWRLFSYYHAHLQWRNDVSIRTVGKLIGLKTKQTDELWASISQKISQEFEQ